MAISNSKYEKLLGIHIDNKLTFEPHVRSLCKKASQKLNAFARIAFSLKFDQRKLLLNAFITFELYNSKELYFKTTIQRLKDFLLKVIPSKLMTVICGDYLLNYLKLK